VTYQSPGVYIEEVPSGPQPIAAASTSVVAVLGTTRKGPVRTPTRVTGWSDFVQIFGPAHSRGFTAESVFGFFENGGPAAWIVRVDPSTKASWNIKDSTPALSFVADATSEGAWANDTSLSVSPDLTGGAGTLARATVASAVTVSTAAIDVPVTSTAGIGPGALVTLVSSTKTRKATVNSVSASAINVTKPSTSGNDIDLVAGDAVTVRTDPTSSTIALAAGTGIKAGDLLVIETGDRTRTAANVVSVTSTGAALAVTLTATAPDLAGVTFAPRFATFAGTISGGSPTFGLSDISWELGDGVVPHSADNQLVNARATLSNGGVASFTSPNFVVAGNAPAPGGRVEVEAQLRVQIYTETIDLTPGTVGGVLSEFGFLPVGGAIRLTGGTKTATVTRTGTGTGDADGTAAGDPLTNPFTTATFVLPADATTGVVVRCAVAPAIGDYVQFAATKILRITGVDNPGGNIYVLHFAGQVVDVSTATNADTGRFPVMTMAPTTFRPMRFTLTVAHQGSVVETFKGLALDPAHPAYFAKDDVVNGVSAYVVLHPRAAAAPAISLVSMPAFAQVASPGADKPATNQDFRNGLTALETQPEPALVICPDSVTLSDPLLQADLVGQVVTHCENFRRFAIIDGPDEDNDVALLAWRNTNLASTYAAMYAPHLQILTIDPESIDRFTIVPPSGFVAGVFARTDRERGVHKAPGNERVTGIVGLRQVYTQRRQDLLNPGSVNLIRAFPGRGSRIWGARNATDDTVWRYVNVRRLFNMIETSVETGTQWVVFEPNTAQTWIRIKASLENFLDQQWRAGALAGTKPEEAYRVRVGLGQTMSETDIDLGLVITEVAIAPAKPAEFVVFRFSHKRLSE
jgi:phage tail sheath protein FI